MSSSGHTTHLEQIAQTYCGFVQQVLGTNPVSENSSSHTSKLFDVTLIVTEEKNKDVLKGFALSEASQLSTFQQACCGAMMEVTKDRDFEFMVNIGIRDIENFLREVNHIPVFADRPELMSELDAFLTHLKLSLLGERILMGVEFDFSGYSRFQGPIALAELTLAERVSLLNELCQQANQSGWSQLGLSLKLVDVDSSEVCYALDKNGLQAGVLASMSAQQRSLLVEFVQSKTLRSYIDFGDRKVVAEPV